MPYIEAPIESEKRLIVLSKEICEGITNCPENNINEINQLIYSIYGLSEAEINIVEEFYDKA